MVCRAETTGDYAKKLVQQRQHRALTLSVARVSYALAILLLSCLFWGCSSDSDGWIGEEVEGRREGVWKQYRDGQLIAEGVYRHGTSHGRFVWYSNGRKVQETTFVDGDLDGPYVFYYPNGQPKFEGSMSAGLDHGPFKFYLSNGTMIAGSYKLGEFHGPYLFFNSRHLPFEERLYEEGELVGTTKLWDEVTGQLSFSGLQQDGKPQGDCTYYRADGAVDKARSGFYVDGVKRQ